MKVTEFKNDNVFPEKVLLSTKKGDPVPKLGKNITCSKSHENWYSGQFKITESKNDKKFPKKYQKRGPVPKKGSSTKKGKK